MNQELYDLIKCLIWLRFRVYTLEFQIAVANAQLCAILEEWHKRLNSPVN